MKRRWVLLLLIAPSLAAFSQPVIHLTSDRDILDVSKSLYYYVDESGKATIHQLVSSGTAIPYKTFEAGSPNIGVTDAVLWCKFIIRSEVDQDCYLDIENSALDSISLYEVVRNDSVIERRSGVTLPYRQRELGNNNYLLKLSGKGETEKMFFLKVRHSRGTQFPVYAGTIKGFAEKFHRDDFIIGIYFGFMILMIFYNLFIYFSVRDSTYLFYVLYVACMAMMNGSLSGYAFEYLWPDYPGFGQYEDLLSASLGISGILFATHFLQTRQNVPWVHRMFNLILALYLVGIMVVLARQFMIGTIFIELVSLLLIVVFFIAAFTTIRKGYRPARFFLAAWSVLLLSVVIFILKDFSVLPVNSLTLHSLEIGSAIEAAVLSLALANRINTYKEEKEAAQELALNSLLENEKLILNQKAILETEVEKRTHELMVEKQKSEDLLLNILPHETAAELKSTGKTKVQSFDNVTVMFTDFVDFSTIAERLEPEQLVREINLCFSEFDAIIHRHNIEKIKTIGDSYMCVAGLPQPGNTHAVDVVLAALEMQEFMLQQRARMQQLYRLHFEMRLGIHTGPVVAGVVGTKKFAYDIWGDTVNVASRMESTGVPGKVNISGTTLQAVNGRFNTTHRGKIEARHKGTIDMYFVDGPV